MEFRLRDRNLEPRRCAWGPNPPLPSFELQGYPTAHSLCFRVFPPRTSVCDARIDPSPGSAVGDTLEGEGVSWPSRICTGREHASVRVPTGNHCTDAACAYNLDSVAEGLQLGASALGDTRLYAQHAGLIGMRPERVDEGFRREARRF